MIDNKEFDNISIKVSFGDYNVTQEGIERSGKSPYIAFKFNNTIIGLETVYDKEWLKELNINDRKNINKYITDITYEDEDGWISLITYKYESSIERLKDNLFNIELKCDYNDILVNENVIIDI